MDRPLEQRRQARVALEATVTFVPRGSSESYRGIARDISLGGIFFLARRVLPIGAELVISMTLPEQDEPIGLAGVVRWQRPDGMGVEFGPLEERVIRALALFISSCSS